MTDKPDSLEEVINKVKIEGMLRILPEDGDKLALAIRKWIRERLPIKMPSYKSEYERGYNQALSDVCKALGVEDLVDINKKWTGVEDEHTNNP